jgi:hypothetical protein
MALRGAVQTRRPTAHPELIAKVRGMADLLHAAVPCSKLRLPLHARKANGQPSRYIWFATLRGDCGVSAGRSIPLAPVGPRAAEPG